jgi:hypothetical protein
MKNTIKSTRALFTAFFALPLAALCCVLSCLNPMAVDKDEPVEYTADGRPLINVSLKTTRGGGGGIMPAR